MRSGHVTQQEATSSAPVSSRRDVDVTPDVSIIMVSYNTRELTVESIRSVQEQTTTMPYEIIVVDNASSDGSAQALQEMGSSIGLIETGENLGFAGANNLAAQRARGRYLLLLNPDTIVQDHAIERIVMFGRAHPDAMIYGGRTMFADGRLNPSSCWARPTLWSMFCRSSGLAAIGRHRRFLDPEAYGGWERTSVRSVDIVSGCFLLIERRLWNVLGGFDPAFFMYGEDADLCLRARAYGAAPLVCPDATIVHYGGQSETVHAEKVIRLLSARVLLLRRHWSATTAPIGVWLHHLWVIRRMLTWTILDALPGVSSRGRAETFRVVWRRRREWSGGASDSDVGAQAHEAGMREMHK